MAIEDETARRNRNKSWWKQRTKMERKLTVGFILAILLIIALIIGIAVAASSKKQSPCLTDACVKEAGDLLRRMNTSVDPCNDFYEFACGRYIAETTMPDDKSDLSPLILISESTNQQVKSVLSEPPDPKEIRPFTFLKKLYKACMNTTAIEENGIEQIRSLLTGLGGFPVLEQSWWPEYDWMEISRRIRQRGFMPNHFMTVDMDVNPKNSTEYIVSIDQAANDEIGEDNLKEGLSDNLMQSYAEFLIDVCVLLGANRDFATKEVHAVIEYRSKVARISVPKAQHIGLVISANETTVAALEKQYPNIPWIYFINGVLAIPNKTITSYDKVVLVTPDYVSQLQNILSQTPKRVQVNHVLLQIIRSLIDFLPSAIRNREQKLLGSVTGTVQSLPRATICVSKSTLYFHLAADALYVQRFVDEEERKDVTEIVTHLRNSLINILKAVDWMDSETKRQAIEKAERITPHIAYPTELRDNKQLQDYYAGLKFESNNILELVCEILKLKRDRLLGLYGTPVGKGSWINRLSTITSNAVYDPQTNSIQIPSGIMKNEFYGKSRPRYMNYGGLGLVIGHELTHGFDDTGKAFDKFGNAVNWWAKSTNDEYSSKAKCFIEQYSSFTAPEVNLTLNGANTLGENIADNGGMKEAYLAYLEWVKENGEELPLPGLNYTPKQLFWISLANAWCTKSRPSAIERDILGDEHSPARYRILGGFSNMRHFSEDFKCPAGSKMNPLKKCQIW